MPTSYLSQINHPDIQNFLIEHEGEDEKQLVLKQKEIFGVPSFIIASQLSGRKKIKSKLPTWYTTKGIIYPRAINLEQCSSEATAIFKAQIIESLVAIKNVAVDLTGGFGVDTFHLSNLFKSVHYVEPNSELLEITKHNHLQLGTSNINHHCLSAEKFIEETDLEVDVVYIDPSRRDERSRKVYQFADCIPDITSLHNGIFKKSQLMLIKASPLLDIQQGLREIPQVKTVFVVSVGNECKELLFLSVRGYEGEPLIEAVDLFENGNVRHSFSFTFTDERNARITLGEPKAYLFEPNASIMKSGAFKRISEKFGLTKLEVNTHLYTSSFLVSDFPGKTFLIECLDPDVKQLKELLPDGKVNVISRNYPLTPDEIKKKLRLRDGGPKFLIGFSSSKKKHITLCSRITGI
jgi:16S rRNA G966 N2-methylase RsmD